VSETDKRNFNHRCEDCSNNEKIIRSVKNYVDKHNEEKSDQQKQEITTENS
jgi:hypothetical protein